MKMNEDAAKFDMTLDGACKKYEKICMDNSPDNRELMYQDEVSGKDSKFFIRSRLCVSLLYSDLQGLPPTIQVERKEVLLELRS